MTEHNGAGLVPAKFRHGVEGSARQRTYDQRPELIKQWLHGLLQTPFPVRSFAKSFCEVIDQGSDSIW